MPTGKGGIIVSDQAAGWLSPFLRSRRIGAALPHIREGKVLDFGCGVGELALNIPSARYIGVDRDEESIELARKRFPDHTFFFADDFAPASYAHSFDVIAGLAIIEHMPAPGAWLRSLCDLLADNGRIILTTPHPRFVWLHTIGANLGVFSREAADEHDQVLDKRQLTELGKEAGLSIACYRRFLAGCNQLCVYCRC